MSRTRHYLTITPTFSRQTLFRHQVKKRTVNPVWKNFFSLKVKNPQRHDLQITVFDHEVRALHGLWLCSIHGNLLKAAQVPLLGFSFSSPTFRRSPSSSTISALQHLPYRSGSLRP
jgi:hypothetical protein